MSELERDPRQRTPSALRFEGLLQMSTLVVAEIDGRDRVEDDRQRVEIPLGEERGKDLDVVPLHQARRVGAHDFDRLADAFQPLRLIGPNERLE